MNKFEFSQRVNTAREIVTARLPEPGVADVTAVTIARELKREVGFCNCDLDNWVPLPSTGHSSVCALHSLSLEMVRPYAEHRIELSRQRGKRAEALLARLYHD